MDDILELAAKLGKRIAEDKRAMAFAEARQKLEEDLKARTLIADYEKLQMSMAELEASGRPIEPENKRKLASLHEQVIGNDVLKHLLKAQADFLQLMTTVTQRMEDEAMRMGSEGK